MLFTIDLDEYLIDVESVAVVSVFSFQSKGVQCAKLDTPKANSFSGHSDASLCEQIFNISVTEIESVVEPDGVTDDVWRKSVALVCIHPPILSISAT